MFAVEKLNVEDQPLHLPHVLSPTSCRAVVGDALLDAGCKLVDIDIAPLFVPLYCSTLTWQVVCDLVAPTSDSFAASLPSVTENYFER